MYIKYCQYSLYGICHLCAENFPVRHLAGTNIWTQCVKKVRARNSGESDDEDEIEGDGSFFWTMVLF